MTGVKTMDFLISAMGIYEPLSVSMDTACWTNPVCKPSLTSIRTSGVPLCPPMT
eukprot:CAMPEP_0171299354 /NCGR_PEP_ID=MMETSP0816-20121228/8171_1 /TAXON_ID=420281 /ORGANISM="Proboscia inermis, Strain CCAP1064/1" /LENGTH=53 /DNA_ID=CAMNT_0011775083 /DNA_START=606 /DNA_END=763 /DNA_ORIENTATION=+